MAMLLRSASRRSGLVFATVGLLCLTGNGTATAAPSSGEIKNLKTTWCVDDSNLGLRAHPCNGYPFQNWIYKPASNGNVALKNASTDRCLDDSVNGLQAIPCNGLPFQRWKLVLDSKKWAFTFVNEETGRCLDDSINGLKTLDCNYSDFQKFTWQGQ